MKKNAYIKLITTLFAFLIGLSNVAADEKGIDAKEYKIGLKKEGAAFVISTVGKGGYHCNTMYPWKVTVKNEKGAETVFKKKDAKVFTEKEVSFSVKGKEATIKLSVCNDQQCIMKTEKLMLK